MPAHLLTPGVVFKNPTRKITRPHNHKELAFLHEHTPEKSTLSLYPSQLRLSNKEEVIDLLLLLWHSTPPVSGGNKHFLSYHPYLR